jgi:hypothetical protein
MKPPSAILPSVLPLLVRKHCPQKGLHILLERSRGTRRLARGFSSFARQFRGFPQFLRRKSKLFCGCASLLGSFPTNFTVNPLPLGYLSPEFAGLSNRFGAFASLLCPVSLVFASHTLLFGNELPFALASAAIGETSNGLALHSSHSVLNTVDRDLKSVGSSQLRGREAL